MVGKLGFKLLILVTLIAVGVFYFIKNPRAGKQLLENNPLSSITGTAVLYKWRDSSGRWQITDRKPAAGIAYETLEYQSDTNVMPLVPRKE